MEEKQTQEFLRVLHHIAAGIDRIGAALTIQVGEHVKHEVIGGSVVSEETQQKLLTAEQLRDKALRVLVETF